MRITLGGQSLEDGYGISPLPFVREFIRSLKGSFNFIPVQVILANEYLAKHRASK
ncbi:hypothetical protein [Taklimakanibacter lacteus]|uniref:hypothetical protein n=1 Tax=Taklimakanibacter lacteus TaxID=2268456 RepID=UPI0034D68C1B